MGTLLDVQNFFKSHGLAEESVVDADGNPLVILAAHQKSWPVVHWLLTEKKHDVMSRSTTAQTLLHIAAKEGAAANVRFLLGLDGMALEAVDDQGRTAVAVAASAKKWKIVKLLVGKYGANKDAPLTHSRQQMTPVLLAAATRAWEMTRWLLEAGCSVDGTDHLDRTLLLITAAGAQWDLVKLILDLDKKIDVNHTGKLGAHAMLLAAEGSQWLLVRDLANKGSNVNLKRKGQGGGPSIISLAAMAGEWELVRYLAKKDATLKDPKLPERAPIYLAAKAEQHGLIKALLQQIPKGDTKQCGLDLSLKLFAQAGNLDMVRLLCEEVHRKNKGQMNLMEFMRMAPGQPFDDDDDDQAEASAGADEPKLARAETKANPFARLALAARKAKTMHKKTHAALEPREVGDLGKEGKEDAVKWAGIDSPSVGKPEELQKSLSKKDLTKNRSTHGVVGGGSDDDSEDGDISAPTSFGRQCIEDAAYANHWHVVEWLLNEAPDRSEADATRESNTMCLLLVIASELGNVDRVKWCVTRGADCHHKVNYVVPGANTSQPLAVACTAAYSGQWDIVKWMLEEKHADLDKCLGVDHTPLVHVAAELGNWDMVQWILRSHGKVEVRHPRNNKTLLMAAVEGGMLEMVKWLVVIGEADVDATSAAGESSLILAANLQHWHIVRWLVCDCSLSYAHVDKEKKSAPREGEPGQTTLAIAAQCGEVAMVEFLIDHGCSPYKCRGSLSVVEVAALHGQLDVVKWLILDLNDKLVQWPSHLPALCALHRQWKIMRWVLDESGGCPVDVNAPFSASSVQADRDKNTAVHLAAVHKAWAEVEYLIIEHGAVTQSRTLELMFEVGSSQSTGTMRVFLHQLLGGGDKQTDALIRRFKRAFPFFDPARLAELCRGEVDKANNPIALCLSLAQMFNKLASANLVHTVQYTQFAQEFSETATKILGDLKSDQLAKWVLEEKVGEPDDHGQVQTALTQGLGFHDLEFIGSARLNRIVEGWWGADKTLRTTFLHKPHEFVRIPYVKLIMNDLSFLGFLAAYACLMLSKISLSNDADRYQKFEKFQPIEYIVLIYGVCYWWREVMEATAQGFRTYIADGWNKVDSGMCLFLIIAFATRFDRMGPHWLNFNPAEDSSEFIYHAALVVTNLLFWVRALHIFTTVASMGPLLISLNKIMTDIWSFSLLIIVVVLAFFFAFVVMIQFESEPAPFSVPFSGKFANPYDLLFFLVHAAWAGEFEDSIRAFENEDSVYFLLQRGTLRLLILAYLFCASLLCVNLLIAMMATTFEAVKKKSEAEFVFLRVTIRCQYDQSENFLPPPFNVPVDAVFAVYRIINTLFFRNTLYRDTYCANCHHKLTGKGADRHSAEPNLPDQWADWDVKEFNEHSDKYCGNCFRVRRYLSHDQFVHENISAGVFWLLMWLPRMLIFALLFLARPCGCLCRARANDDTTPVVDEKDKGDHHAPGKLARTNHLKLLDAQKTKRSLWQDVKGGSAKPPAEDGYRWTDYQHEGSFFTRDIVNLNAMADRIERNKQETQAKIDALKEAVQSLAATLARVAGEHSPAPKVRNDAAATSPSAMPMPDKAPTRSMARGATVTARPNSSIGGGRYGSRLAVKEQQLPPRALSAAGTPRRPGPIMEGSEESDDGPLDLLAHSIRPGHENTTNREALPAKFTFVSPAENVPAPLTPPPT